MSRVSVVIPCFDEERRFDTDAFRAFLADDPDTRLILVDDGSRDRTADVLDALRREVPDRVTVLALENNSGKAEAVRRGVLAAMERGDDLVGYWDADLATPLDAIGQFVRVLEMRPDVVLAMGARVALLGRTIERRATRHYAGRVFATAVSLLLGLRVYDTQCGAKMLRVDEATRAAFARPFRSRWIFDVELIARLLGRRGGEAGARILELPLWCWRDVGGSKLKISDFIKAGPALARIWWHDLRRRAVAP